MRRLAAALKAVPRHRTPKAGKAIIFRDDKRIALPLQLINNPLNTLQRLRQALMHYDDRAWLDARNDSRRDALGVGRDAVESASGPSDESHIALRKRRMYRGVLHSDRRAKISDRPENGIAAVDLLLDPRSRQTPERR